MLTEPRNTDLTITVADSFDERHGRTCTTILQPMIDEQVVSLKFMLNGHEVLITINPSQRAIMDNNLTDPGMSSVRDESLVSVHIDDCIVQNIMPANSDIYGENALIYSTWKYLHCPGEEFVNPQSGMDCNVVFMDDQGKPGIMMDANEAASHVKEGIF